MTIYRRKLPHIEKDGGSYFISFTSKRPSHPEWWGEGWPSIIVCTTTASATNWSPFVVMSTHVHLILTPLPTRDYFRWLGRTV